MQFSIITICFNPGEFLRYAVESVLCQQYPSINYIIVDGGSTDGTRDYVLSLQGRISKFVSEPDRGIYDALNKGVRMATGDVVCLMHSDDMFSDNMVISRVADVFKQANTDAVYGDLVYVDKHRSDKTIRFWKSGEYSPKKLKWGWMPPHPALFVKRSVYEKARMSNGDFFNTSYKIAADYEFMMRILGRMKISLVYLPIVLVKMRIGGKSNKSLKNIIIKSIEDYNAVRQNRIGGVGTLIAKNLRKLPQFFL